MSNATDTVVVAELLTTIWEVADTKSSSHLGRANAWHGQPATYKSVDRKVAFGHGVKVLDDDELLRRLSANLRRIRADRGLSQEKLAEFLGVHRTYVGSMERAQRNLSLRSLTRMAKQLGVDPLELLRP